MLRIRSRNSAGRSSSARATSRAKRACRRRDMTATLVVALCGLSLLAERGSETAQRTTADPAGRVRAERGAEVAAVALRGLHQADDAPRDQVLAVRPATAWIE